MRRVMEKELLNERMGSFYLRLKGKSEQTRAISVRVCVKETMVGGPGKAGKYVAVSPKGREKERSRGHSSFPGPPGLIH